MQCNISQVGRRVRMAWGVLMLLLAAGAATLWFLGLLTTIPASIATAVLTALGLFGIYEARKGWCAMRAMGFKTPV